VDVPGLIAGTQGYADAAAELIARYESVSFAQKFASVLHLVPPAPARVLDVGAGTGVDAAWFAALGHRVVAVEPTDELREAGMRLHASAPIRWIKDALPDLRALAGSTERFDFVLLSAVWMHLDAPQRRTAMRNLRTLLADGGRLVLSLRHGPVPGGRRMFDVSAEETIALAQACGLRAIVNVSAPSVQPENRRAGVTWTVLGFVATEKSG
jgi:SAM-dependent methyltransferase